MLKQRRKFILSLAFLLTGCASTTVPYSSEHENTWFLENRGGRVFPIYCMANKKEKTADPKCFEADKSEIRRNW
jgi:hypothetical protein